ncbi:MAG: PilZ domain-containing protein [Candidatus Acidiferrales bacterium]
MPDDPFQSPKGEPSIGKGERRTVPRYPFIASAKETDVETGAELAGRVSELSQKGCFIDTPNPFARKTRIRLTIYHGNKVFNALGKVIYVLPNMGMGVVFTEVEPQEMQVLLAWLRECAGAPTNPN